MTVVDVGPGLLSLRCGARVAEKDFTFSSHRAAAGEFSVYGQRVTRIRGVQFAKLTSELTAKYTPSTVAHSHTRGTPYCTVRHVIGHGARGARPPSRKAIAREPAGLGERCRGAFKQVWPGRGARGPAGPPPAVIRLMRPGRVAAWRRRQGGDNC